MIGTEWGAGARPVISGSVATNLKAGNVPYASIGGLSKPDTSSGTEVICLRAQAPVSGNCIFLPVTASCEQQQGWGGQKKNGGLGCNPPI
jgi:hypothetical protein